MLVAHVEVCLTALFLLCVAEAAGSPFEIINHDYGAGKGMQQDRAADVSKDHHYAVVN